MSKPDIFTLFPHLPSELRLAIWHHAFSSPVTISFTSFLPYPSLLTTEPLWTTSPATTEPDLQFYTTEPHDQVIVISPNHMHASTACKEAWSVMTQCLEPACFSPFRAHERRTTHWVDFENTTFDLGSGQVARDAIYTLSRVHVPVGKIGRVVLVFESYRNVIETVKRLDVFMGLGVVEIRAGVGSEKVGALYDGNLQGSIERFLGRLFVRIGKRCPRVEVQRTW